MAAFYLEGQERVRMKEKILELLKNSKGYVSGEAISHQLGVSRTAIWKGINRLKEEGYTIRSVRNKGYCLEEEPVVLVEDALRSYLPRPTVFSDVYVYESIESTNQAAKALWQKGLHKPALIFAREQTGGKGRRGKQWLSPKDEGIFMSMLLSPDIAPHKGSMLTLVAGLATAEAIAELTGLEPLIKWPNDVVIGDKKVCGILTEMSAEMDYIHYLVVGVGINVNQSYFEDEIVTMATSLKKVTGKTVNCNALAGLVIKAFEKYYQQFLEEGSLTFMMGAYNQKCVNIGRELQVITRNGSWEGVGEKVSEDGTLQICRKDGTIINVNAGEVSVRGLYGYV